MAGNTKTIARQTGRATLIAFFLTQSARPARASASLPGRHEMRLGASGAGRRVSRYYAGSIGSFHQVDATV